MAHEVLGDLFFQDRKAPAWHGIMREGVEERDYTAEEVFTLFGSIDVRLAKLRTVGTRPDGSFLEIPYNAIVRGPAGNDPNPKVLGVVGPDYKLVPPKEIVELWDSEVGRKIQTMMFLRDAKLMVITCKLESFSARGEEVECFAQIGNWMDGANATTAIVSRVCTVCMNTWQMANASAMEQYRFTHDQYITHRMSQWFKDVLARADGSQSDARQVMEALCDFRLNKENAQPVVTSVLRGAYPEPAPPKEDPLAPKEYNDKRAEQYEALRKTVDIRRVTAFDLFKGAGVGMALPSRKGTLWGLYQAVCEVEDYRKGSTGDGLASSILFGDRGQTKDRAYKSAVALLD
jgi:hypothetical protein